MGYGTGRSFLGCARAFFFSLGDATASLYFEILSITNNQLYNGNTEYILGQMVRNDRACMIAEICILLPYYVSYTE